MNTGNLTLAHDLLLLTIDPDTGARHKKDEASYALVGGLLAELALAGRIDVEDKKVEVRSTEPTGRPLADDLLSRIAADKQRKPQQWVEKLHKEYTERVLQDLVTAEIIAPRQDKVMGLLPVTHYALVTPSARQERLLAAREVIEGNPAVVNPRAVILATLAMSAGVKDELHPGMSAREAKRVLKERARGEWASEAVRKAIESAQSAGAAAGAIAAGM